MTEKNPNWGGPRPGAGRPRTESLDAAECWYLAEVLSKHSEGEENAQLIAKLQKMGNKTARFDEFDAIIASFPATTTT